MTAADLAANTNLATTNSTAKTDLAADLTNLAANLTDLPTDLTNLADLTADLSDLATNLADLTADLTNLANLAAAKTANTTGRHLWWPTISADIPALGRQADNGCNGMTPSAPPLICGYKPPKPRIGLVALTLSVLLAEPPKAPKTPALCWLVLSVALEPGSAPKRCRQYRFLSKKGSWELAALFRYCPWQECPARRA